MSYEPITPIPPTLLSFADPQLRALERVWSDRRRQLERTASIDGVLEHLHREWAIETGLIEREAAVGTDSLEMAQVDYAVGASQRQLGDLPRARDELGRALARTTVLLGAEHPVRVAIARELTAVERELDTATVDVRVGARP